MATATNFNVESKIRVIWEDNFISECDYLFLNWAQANVALDGIKRPTIVYVLPPSGNLYLEWHQTTDRPTTQIAFLCNTEFDFDTLENDALMVAMKTLAARFIRAINESGYFEPIDYKTEIPYQCVYDYLDQNVTGVLITLELKEKEGLSACETDE